MAFSGFPEQMLTFYEGLEADNSRPYWTDHRGEYEACVAAPMRDLLDELGPEFGEAKMFRPYRDIRFSRDKTPYKTHAGAVLQGEPGEGVLYVQVSAEGLLVAGGYYSCSTDQAQRLRAAVADERIGRQLDRILEELARQGFSTAGERLKRVPKPFDPDDPRAELLRAKSLHSMKRYAPDDVLHRPELARRIAGDWRALRPLCTWLADYVGASRAPART